MAGWLPKHVFLASGATRADAGRRKQQHNVHADAGWVAPALQLAELHTSCANVLQERAVLMHVRQQLHWQSWVCMLCLPYTRACDYSIILVRPEVWYAGLIS
jgi:hypothetical protein